LAKMKNEFKSELPPCGGCDTCGDLHEGHLYLLGYTGKYYCKVCFFKVARWPNPSTKQSREPVEISDRWYAKAIECGTARFNQAMEKGLKRDAGLPGENDNRDKMLADHILGAAGELAYAKFARKAWRCNVNAFSHGGDVQDDQVRTRSKDWYDLNIKQKDARAHPDSDFVLALGKHGSREFTIVGWINIKEAMQDKWLKSPGGGRPGWFVPQSSLHPFPKERAKC